MPKKTVRKKLNKLKKGTLVKWAKQDEKPRMWETAKPLLRCGDLGILLGEDHGTRAPNSDKRFFIWWQRLGIKRSMSFRDFRVVKT